MLLGRLLAERGHTILSGGYGGLMEAVSRGAHRAGGTVVGVTLTPWAGRLQPNRFLSEERAAATLFQRIEGLLESDCLIALKGGAGTLGEVALAWNMSQMDLMPSKPVILVGQNWKRLLQAFQQQLVIDERDLKLLTHVQTVTEAISAIDQAVPESSSPQFRG